jgi:hypothetical protein
MKSPNKIIFDKKNQDWVYLCHYLDRPLAKNAGFNWSPSRRVWKTSKIYTVTRHEKLCDDLARIELNKRIESELFQKNAEKNRLELLNLVYEPPSDNAVLILRLSDGYSISEEFAVRSYEGFCDCFKKKFLKLQSRDFKGKRYQMHIFCNINKLTWHNVRWHGNCGYFVITKPDLDDQTILDLYKVCRKSHEMVDYFENALKGLCDFSTKDLDSIRLIPKFKIGQIILDRRIASINYDENGDPVYIMCRVEK